jgi:hypothetical protein
MGGIKRLVSFTRSSRSYLGPWGGWNGVVVADRELTGVGLGWRWGLAGDRARLGIFIGNGGEMSIRKYCGSSSIGRKGELVTALVCPWAPARWRSAAAWRMLEWPAGQLGRRRGSSWRCLESVDEDLRRHAESEGEISGGALAEEEKQGWYLAARRGEGRESKQRGGVRPREGQGGRVASHGGAGQLVGGETRGGGGLPSSRRAGG